MTLDDDVSRLATIKYSSSHLRSKTRWHLLVLINAVVAMTSGIARAQAISSADQLADRFTSFCLGHRLAQADLSRRASRLRAIQESVMSSDGYRRILWRDATSHDDVRYSFDVSARPRQHLRIVGCSVGGHDVSAAAVITALEQPLKLGKSNDNSAPSLIARSAGWFFVKNREPHWVSVMDIRVGDNHQVIVGLSTHQRLPP